MRQSVKNLLLQIAGPGIQNNGSTNATSDIQIYCYRGTTPTANCTNGSSFGDLVEVDVTFSYAPLPLFSAPFGLSITNWSTVSLYAKATAFAE